MKHTRISRDALLADITALLKGANVAYSIENASTGTAYIRTKNGNIRISDHNESPYKLNNNIATLIWDSPIHSDHYFKNRQDKKNYVIGLNFALQAALKPG